MLLGRSVPLGNATLDADGLVRVAVHRRRVLWIPDAAADMKKRFLVYMHMQETGQKGVDATLARTHEYCV